jgi:pyruvate ferredoxin oxidoreductase delta subunit
MSGPSSLPTWRELAPGGIIPEGGTAQRYHTGGWRSQRPVFHPEACIHCLTCWILCPDAAIEAKDGKVLGYDYAHCKGCGICKKKCPNAAIVGEIKHSHYIVKDKCIRCGVCAEVCPFKAIHVS